MNRAVRARTGTPAVTSLVGGAGALAASRYLSAGINWAGTVLIARQLTEAEFGRFSFMFALLGVIGLVSSLRIGRLVLSSVLPGTEGAERAGGSYVAFRLVIGVVSYAVALVFVVAGGYPPDVVHGIAVAGLIVTIGSCASAFELLFHARMWMPRVALITAAAQLAQLGCVVGLVVSGRASVVWFTVPALVAIIVRCSVLGLSTRRLVRLTIAPSMWWGWMKEAAPLTLGGLLTATYTGIDTLLLSKLDTFAAVGLYSVGYKFADIIGSLPGAVMTPAFVILVQAWPDDLGRFRHAFRQSLGLLVIIGVGLGVGFISFAPSIIDLFYGERFAPAADAARMLVASKVINIVNVLCLTTLTAVGRHRLYPVAALIGVAFNVLVNLVVIPRYSYNGSAAVTLATEVVVLVMLGAATSRVPGVRPLPWGLLLRTVASGAATVAVVLVTRDAMPWYASAVLSGAVYLGAVHVLRVAGPGGLRAVLRPEVDVTS